MATLANYSDNGGDSNDVIIYESPLSGTLAEEISHLLGHKSEPFKTDIAVRLIQSQEKSSNIFAICKRDGRAVSHVWIAYNRYSTEWKVGILGHVFTEEKYRRKGLATAVLKKSIEYFYEQLKGKFLILISEPDAYNLYHKLGFKPLRISGEKGKTMMVHYINSLTLLDDYYSPQPVCITTGPMTRQHSADIIALLGYLNRESVNCAGELEIGSAISAEKDAIYLMMKIEQNKLTATVCIEEAVQRVYGLIIKIDDNHIYQFIHPCIEKLINI